MKTVFEKVAAVCAVCGLPLNGDSLKQRGDKYYCEADYEKTSITELNENNFQIKRKEKYDKIFQ